MINNTVGYWAQTYLTENKPLTQSAMLHQEHGTLYKALIISILTAQLKTRGANDLLPPERFLCSLCNMRGVKAVGCHKGGRRT